MSELIKVSWINQIQGLQQPFALKTNTNKNCSNTIQELALKTIPIKTVQKYNTIICVTNKTFQNYKTVIIVQMFNKNKT